MRPVTDPTTIDIWLIPSALPLSDGGNVSVIIAALFENRKPAPMACTTLNEISSIGDCDMLHSPEPMVKMAKPIL
jgi:hypothetical protein